MLAMMPIGTSRRIILAADCRRCITVATATAAEHRTGAKAAAAMDGAAPEAATASTTVKDRAASEATSASATSAAMASMAASDFDRWGIGDMLRCRRGAGIDQRKCQGGLAWQGQHQDRGSRKAPATDKAAPGIWNLQHW